MPMGNSVRHHAHDVKILYIAGIDLRERAEACIRVISRRHGPFAGGKRTDQIESQAANPEHRWRWDLLFCPRQRDRHAYREQ